MFAGTRFTERVIANRPLSELTTLGVGGPADYYIAAETSDEIPELIRLCHEKGIMFRVLGGGSNVLASDTGFRGLIIHNKTNTWQIVGEPQQSLSAVETQARWETVGTDVDIQPYDEKRFPEVLVRTDSGCMVQRLMLDLLTQGVTGLEWYSGIPATIGGAVYMNMHGAQKFFGNDVVAVRVVSSRGAVSERSQADMQFRYDWSILHDTKDVVLDVTIRLRRGPVDQAKTIMTSWLKKKNETQPKRSCGSVFQNLSPEEQARLDIPTPGAGYVIDKLLDLNGYQIGGARIADNNGNFMVNTGAARAEDFAILIAYVKEQARNKLGLALHEEVEYLGFGV